MLGARQIFLQSNITIHFFLQGMAYIHSGKTSFGSHGNLKPSNILVTRNFTLKISDFGESIFLVDMKRNYNHSETQHNKRMHSFTHIFHVFFVINTLSARREAIAVTTPGILNSDRLFFYRAVVASPRAPSKVPH